MHTRALHYLRPLLRTMLPWLVAATFPLHAAPTPLVIATGPLNGVYYPTGGAICRLLNAESSQHGLQCTVQSTTGSIANLTALHKGRVQLALMQSDIAQHAARGSGPFLGQQPDEALRVLFRLYRESLTLVVSPTSNITTLADLNGKRVDLGNPGSGTRVTTDALLEAMGWHADQFVPPPPALANSRLEGLCNDTLDAVFMVTGHPNQGIGELSSRCKVRLIPIEGEVIDRLLGTHPYYQRSHIGANLYPDQIERINTFAVSSELIALDSLPEAEVRTVRDVLSARLKQFTRLHPALTTLTQEEMLAETALPRHTGMQDAVAPTIPEAASPSEATATLPEASTPLADPASASVTTAPAPESTAHPEQASAHAEANPVVTPAAAGSAVDTQLPLAVSSASAPLPQPPEGANAAQVTKPMAPQPVAQEPIPSAQ